MATVDFSVCCPGSDNGEPEGYGLGLVRTDVHGQEIKGENKSGCLGCIGASFSRQLPWNTGSYVVGGDSSHGQVQPVGRLPVSGSSLRRHGLQAGHHGRPPAAEGGGSVRAGGSLCSWRTGRTHL